MILSPEMQSVIAKSLSAMRSVKVPGKRFMLPSLVARSASGRAS